MKNFSAYSMIMVLKKFFLFLMCIILITFLLELYLREVGISLPSYVYDNKILGRTQFPGKEIFQAGAEGFCIDRVNSYGYTGNGYPPLKDTNTIRFALFGSSYIEGIQVFRRNRFSTILEKELSKKFDNKVEVLNFAIGGDDFRGMFFRYLKFAQDFQPDYFIFMIQSQALYKKKSIPSPEVYIENDSLKISYKYIHSSETLLRERFKLVRLSAIGNIIKEGFEAYYNGMLPSVILDKFYRPESKVISSKAEHKDTYFSINKKIIDYLDNQNHLFPIKNIIVKLDTLPKGYNQYLSLSNFPQIDLFDDLHPYGEEKLHYWKASGMLGHWNNFAHHIVGKILAERLYNFINEKRN